MKKSAWFKTTLAVAIATVSSHSLANGLTINEQSASSMGTGFAGRSSSAIDASTVFGNPAGMSKLDRAEVSGGFAVIDASTDISGGDNGRGTNDGDMVPLAAIPFGYYVRPLNEKMHFGLGMYAPFGVISDYEDGFAARNHGLYSKVQVVTLQPTLSYQITDRVSVGFGPTINKIDGKLTSNPLTPVGELEVNIKGDDVGYGFNAGVLVDVTDKLAWGLTYHSKVDYELEGRTRITGAPAPVGINGSYDAKLDFTSPESVDTSVTYQLDDQWTLHAGTTWTRWSQLQEIVVDNRGVTGPFAGAFTSIDEQLTWNDTWSFAFGAAYQLNPQWVLRTGFALDESPTTDADRTVRIPVGDRKILSLGAGWNATDDLTVDFAYAYLREDKSEVNYDDYSAEFRNTAHGLSTQVTYRF
ncbi:transporter [Pseudomonas sp. gcc21]|uniref:OmpP1/FadL family transporter n=1 Tax=Pseudomonas sp. gcc21 TaxID=2726989 RepID=UPI0014520B1F|nr:outer membrane protein transport protein [Pseudomonas sp. gcc21]QJD58254.1 transporter [Pseudomonas sp. gcc21]